MTIKQLIETINFERHDFSILLIDPMPEMIEWVKSFAARRGLIKYRLYYPEGNRVVIIPKVDRFGSQNLLEDFINRLKPGLLRMELRRFQAKPEDFEHPITVATFDRFFSLNLRDEVNLISDFNLSTLAS
jgi:hypothetical protein